jgi:hypothetical protein
MDELRAFVISLVFAPLFAPVFGLVAWALVSALTRGTAAARYRSRPVVLLLTGYAIFGAGTFYLLVDGGGDHRVGPFAGVVVSFALLVYLRRLRRRRAASGKGGIRRRAVGRPRADTPDGGSAGVGDVGNAGGTAGAAGGLGGGSAGTGWVPGRPRPVARPPGSRPAGGTQPGAEPDAEPS